MAAQQRPNRLTVTFLLLVLVSSCSVDARPPRRLLRGTLESKVHSWVASLTASFSHDLTSTDTGFIEDDALQTDYPILELRDVAPVPAAGAMRGLLDTDVGSAGTFGSYGTAAGAPGAYGSSSSGSSQAGGSRHLLQALAALSADSTPGSYGSSSAPGSYGVATDDLLDINTPVGDVHVSTSSSVRRLLQDNIDSSSTDLVPDVVSAGDAGSYGTYGSYGGYGAVEIDSRVGGYGGDDTTGMHGRLDVTMVAPQLRNIVQDIMSEVGSLNQDGLGPERRH